MARRKKHEEHENHERWLVSYADFITLLFAFFVVMYSVSSVNEGKYRVLSDALMSAFRSTPKSLQPIQVGKPSKSPVMSQFQYQSTPSVLIVEKKGIDYANKDGFRKLQDSRVFQSQQGDSELGKIQDSIAQAMAELIDMGVINVSRKDTWLEIEIKNSILFNSGSANLKTNVIPLLNNLASILSNFPNSIKIEGYTDTDKIDTDKYPSNWELSSARAASIVRVFELSNILPERMSVVGYGETRPVADNSTPEGKEKNRRVVIMVMPNNDVAKTIRKDEKSPPQGLPSDVSLKDERILDVSHDSAEGVSEPQVRAIRENDTDTRLEGMTTDESSISTGQRAQPAPPPSINQTDTQFELNNPVISPPIRLFTPIELPIPLDNSGNENQAGSQP